MVAWSHHWFHLIRFDVLGVMFFHIVQQKEKNISLGICIWLVGLWVFTYLNGIRVGSWRRLQHFCSFALVKTLHVFLVLRGKKGRKHRFYGSDYSSLRFQLVMGRLFSGLCQVD